MHGLTIQNVNFAQVLKPLETTLNDCWWWVGGAGITFPDIRPAATLPQRQAPKVWKGPGRYSHPQRMSGPIEFDPADFERYMAESNAASEEYAKWIELLGDQRVGKPGYFGRYAKGLGRDWDLYFASDAPALESSGLSEAAQRFFGVWFDPPPDMPPDILLIARTIDAAYMDAFLRDEWMMQTLQAYLERSGIEFRPFKPLRPELP